MQIDCQACPVQGRHCRGCAFALVLDRPGLPLDDAEAGVVETFRVLGLIDEEEALAAHAWPEPLAAAVAG